MIPLVSLVSGVPVLTTLTLSGDPISIPGVSHDGAPAAALRAALRPGLLLPVLAAPAAPGPEETLRVQE